MLTNPTELLAFLRSLGVQPKKGLSQNFLIDGNIIKKIVAAAEIQSGDQILEIGPGPGALTEALVGAGAKVTAVEMDRVFAAALNRFPNVEVFEADILKFELDQITPPTKVVSNLPYHLTAPILTRLAPRSDLFTSVTVMVQEEVARRIVAKPKSKIYGSLTIFLNFYSEPRYAFKVSRNCFYPAPKVDSAVVVLKLKQPPAVDPVGFFDLVHAVFQQRRKMVKSVLGKEAGVILEELGEDPQSRPEDLSLETFLKLYSRSSVL